jgi:hypothetical protein
MAECGVFSFSSPATFSDSESFSFFLVSLSWALLLAADKL